MSAHQFIPHLAPSPHPATAASSRSHLTKEEVERFGAALKQLGASLSSSPFASRHDFDSAAPNRHPADHAVAHHPAAPAH